MSIEQNRIPKIQDFETRLSKLCERWWSIQFKAFQYHKRRRENIQDRADKILYGDILDAVVDALLENSENGKEVLRVLFASNLWSNFTYHNFFLEKLIVKLASKKVEKESQRETKVERQRRSTARKVRKVSSR